jgi:hypothetical protein
LPDAQRPVKCISVARLRAMAKHIGGDGLDVFEIAQADFERQAAMANATAAGCCALACQRAWSALAAAGRTVKPLAQEGAATT